LTFSQIINYNLVDVESVTSTLSLLQTVDYVYTAATNKLLLEDADKILLEDGSFLLLEG